MKRTLLALSGVMLIALSASACTDFQVKARDGSVIIARSMEFAIELNSEVVAFPRGGSYTSVNEKGAKGISWTAKYGFLGVNAFGMQDAVLDGMNEAGLSIEFLWFPGSVYQKAVPGKFIEVTDMSRWILGSFATVDEVKKAVTGVKVVGSYIPQLKQSPGLHCAVHDAKGNNIVIEFIDGKTRVHDNPLGVMTNRPTLDWHLDNLRNYFALSSEDISSRQLGRMKLPSTGAGNSWLGLPGDWTPPSRFIKAAYFVHSAPPARDAKEALTFARHVMNSIDIPYGLIKEHVAGRTVYGYTQWVVLKDLSQRVLYYYSYEDAALKQIDMKKLNFAAGSAVKAVPVEGHAPTADVTSKLI